MPTQSTEDPAPLAPALWSVAAMGALLTLASPVLLGASAVASVAAGAAMAVANLWAVGRLVRNFLTPGQRGSWASLAVIKIGILLLLLTVLVSSGIAQILPLLLGYGALPLGIVVAQLKSPPVARGEGSKNA